jgi:copper chaperone
MQTTLQISGMTCEHCVRHVSLALAAVPGAESVSVDLASASARISGDAAVQALIAAVAEAGYQAQLQSQASGAAGGCGCGSNGCASH